MSTSIAPPTPPHQYQQGTKRKLDAALTSATSTSAQRNSALIDDAQDERKESNDTAMEMSDSTVDASENCPVPSTTSAPDEDSDSDSDSDDDHSISRTHPRGVKPLGNQLFEPNVVPLRARGFGILSRLFTDAQLLDFLRTHLLSADIITLNQVSRAMYIISNEEEIWKELVLQKWQGEFVFQKDWKETYAKMRHQKRYEKNFTPNSVASTTTTALPPFTPLPPPLKFPGFYSDEIFQSFYCAHIDLEEKYGAVMRDNIERIAAADMSEERFKEEYGKPNRPVLVTGLMEDWGCYSSSPENSTTRWTVENWSRQYSDVRFKVGRYTMSLKNYFQYMHSIRSDESPLYLFDSKFAEKCPAMRREYDVPKYFRKDFFDLLNDDDEVEESVKVVVKQVKEDEKKKNQAEATTSSSAASAVTSPAATSSTIAASSSTTAAAITYSSLRPSYRWILVGPARSGSTFHKDPNHTSAWNALISGKKLWIMYPPDQPPPGVFPSQNGAEVATPISVAEWMINNYSEHRRKVEEYEEEKRYQLEQWRRRVKEHEKLSKDEQKDVADSEQHPNKKQKRDNGDVATPSSSSSLAPPPYTPGPVEAVCQPGEVIFIPNGWWHTALNLTPSFAVTQNYVNEENLWNVCDFLESDEGERDRNLPLLAALMSKLNQHRPDLAQMIEQKKVDKEIARMEQEEQEERAKRGKKKSSLWERLIAPSE